MKIYFTSFDILQENYSQPGLIFFRKGMYDEIFRLEFIGNKKNRYKRWINKTVFLSKFLEDLSEEIGLKQVNNIFFNNYEALIIVLYLLLYIYHKISSKLIH